MQNRFQMKRASSVISCKIWKDDVTL